jgi:hypothetical protein
MLAGKTVSRCCNSKSAFLKRRTTHIQNVEDAREAVELLRAEYGLSSWQGNFKRFEVLDNLDVLDVRSRNGVESAENQIAAASVDEIPLIEKDLMPL